MPGQFLSPDGDLESAFVSDPAIIDQFAKTGSLWSWGNNAAGQIGDGTTTIRRSPVLIAGTTWLSVSKNGTSSSPTGAAGIKTDGSLWVWGKNDGSSAGRIGDGTEISKSSPVQVTGTWKMVSAGTYHTAAIKTDGTLWGWGSNIRGQIGNNTSGNNISTPVQTTLGGNDWKMVSCGGYAATAAIKTDGTLWAMGYVNAVPTGGGQYQTPTQVPGTTWKQVSIGYSHGGAVKTDGTLWSWGYNNSSYYITGNGTDTSTYSPVQTSAGGTNWKQISCGNNNTAAIKTDGTLWMWGYNASGQIGNNSIVSASTPVQTIAGGTNWKMVSAGCYTTMGIKTDGTLWTWGAGYHGNLGDGGSADKSSPIQTVAGGTNWKQVSSGSFGGIAIYFYDAGDLYPTAY